MKRASCIVLLLIGLLTFAPMDICGMTVKQRKGTKRIVPRRKRLSEIIPEKGSSSITSFCMEGRYLCMMSADNSNNFSNNAGL